MPFRGGIGSLVTSLLTVLSGDAECFLLGAVTVMMGLRSLSDELSSEVVGDQSSVRGCERMESEGLRKVLINIDGSSSVLDEGTVRFGVC